MLQRRPVEKLHDQKRAAVLLADIVDRADIGVVQRRCRARLAVKPGQRLGIPRQVRRQELQRGEAMEPCVFRLVHDAHTAAADALDDLVVGYPQTDQGLFLDQRLVLMVGGLDCRPLEEAAGLVLQPEQRLELLLEPGIARAQLVEQRLTLRRRQWQCRLQ